MKLPPRQRAWLYLVALVCVAEPIVAFDVYALFVNKTAHTGFPTRWLAWGMLAVTLVALLAWWAERRGTSRSCRVLALAIALTGLVGAANVLSFEHLNVLMDYEIWVKQKHMPGKYAPPGMGYQLPNFVAPAEEPAD